MIDVTFRPSEAEHPGTVAGGILCIPRGFMVHVPKKILAQVTRRLFP